MSILDLILGQKIILLTLGLALAPLLAAALLSLLARVRLQYARRAARRQLAAALRVQVDEHQNTGQPVTITEEAVAEIHGPIASTPASDPVLEPEADNSKLALDDQPDSEELVSSDMQDLLSSVFGDDEAASYYKILLQDSDDVTTSALVELSQEILGQLRVS